MSSDFESSYVAKKIDSLRGKKVLVTGAAGFIGGALARRLKAYDVDLLVTALYPEEVSQLENEGFTARLLDLASDTAWDDYVRGIDIVFHIAAMFQDYDKGAALYNKVNNEAVVKLAQAAARAGATRFVHCSTVGVHGDVREIPATEETPFNPMDIYHKTKLAGELALLEYARTLPSDGMVVTVNRPSMVYGPGDIRMKKLFTTVSRGHFMMIGNGDVLAHVCYIDDQVDSLLLNAIAPRERVHCEAFNIASAEPITLNNLVKLIAEYTHASIPGIKLPVSPIWFAALICELLCKPFGISPPLFRRRVGFFTHNRAFDITKARTQLGYTPRFSERDGVHATIDWYRKEGAISE